ncbi:MAG: hypothetical protein ACYTFG_05820 [Planctomycetota bacterium]
MICEHLRELEKAIVEAGIEETHRGKVWTEANEWVYFDCVIDLDACRKRFSLPGFVKDHAHRSTHDGTEQGLYCEKCKDGVMGRHAEAFPSENHFP